MQRVAVAAADVLDLRHFFLEGGVIGCLDQVEALAVSGMKAADDLFGRTTPREFPNFRTLSSTMMDLRVITVVITYYRTG